MATYNHLININKVPSNVTKIGVYNSNNDKVGIVPIPSANKLDTSNLGTKLYSFGCVSDIHLSYDTAESDFQKALQYFENTEDVDFVCVCGDLTANGTPTELAKYKNLVDTYSPNTPVYSIWGNHEGWNSQTNVVKESYTGHPLYYKFEKGNDVFLMVGCNGITSGVLFTTEEMQWLFEQLEINRNKRVFLFQHVRPDDACGNAFGIYATDIWAGTEKTIMDSLFKHYHNITMFHGHSHLKFYLQYGSDVANYDTFFGCNSIHIPSLSVPRDGDVAGASSRQEIYAESEGYVVDVYSNHIVLRGRDFVDDKFVPMAIYQIPTTLQTITANTYTDSTGTLNTSGTYSVTNNLSNATNSNVATSITIGSSYTATITANTDYIINTITVTMGDNNITETVVVGNVITIPNVIGNVVITVTTNSTSVPCTDISLSASLLTFAYGSSAQTLTTTVVPSNTTDPISWSSSNTSIATVSNGVVTPIAGGTCTITATCGSQSATCNVTVASEYTLLSTSWEIGNLSTSTGAEEIGTNYARTDFIPVNVANKTYWFTNVFNTTSNSTYDNTGKVQAVSILAYDSNQNFIQRIVGTDGNYFHTCNPRRDITSYISTATNVAFVKIRIQTYDGSDITETYYNAVKLEEK